MTFHFHEFNVAFYILLWIAAFHWYLFIFFKGYPLIVKSLKSIYRVFIFHCFFLSLNLFVSYLDIIQDSHFIHTNSVACAIFGTVKLMVYHSSYIIIWFSWCKIQLYQEYMDIADDWELRSLRILS